jgi:hypothetical protein
MMNKLSIFTLKVLRKIYTKATGTTFVKPECEQNPNVAAQIIYDALMSEKPCMIARFGSTELSCLKNYLGVKNNSKRYIDYIIGKAQSWWWDDNIINQMQMWSGFFPARKDKIEQFCELLLRDIPEVDVLGSWLVDEQLFKTELKNCSKINFELLNPYFSSIPWTKALEGKKVLVVHPFANAIALQYKKRELLFKDNLLPKFELMTVKAVQSIAGNTTQFADWFDALNYMKAEIDKHEYDICLIGCGAYGFHLATHVKRMNKKAVHLGGSLQLLFGIKGKRWEDSNYNPIYNYARLMNEYWIYPADEDKPKNANIVEDACYW